MKGSQWYHREWKHDKRKEMWRTIQWVVGFALIMTAFYILVWMCHNIPPILPSTIGG